MKMDNPNIILTELSEISPLIAGIRKVNIYSIPSSYFDNFAEDVIQNINSPTELLNSLSPVTPYQVSDTYFIAFQVIF
jgi:hypothetical protein